MSAGVRSSSWTALRRSVVWEGLQDALEALGEGPLAVVDAGGGSGGLAVPLAELGHRVGVVDPSPDSLAALERRAAERGVGDRIVGRQGDLSTLPELVPSGSADVLLCHGVLEVIDDPARALAAAVAAVREGGMVSILAANRMGAVLARALAGHPDEALAALEDPAGRWGRNDRLARRFDRPALLRMVTEAGLEIETVHGIRIVLDLLPGSMADADPEVTDALARLERAASRQPVLGGVATQFHVLARRP